MEGLRSFFALIEGKIKRIGKLLPRLVGKDFSVFLLFLGISFMFWWVRTMSRNYEMYIHFPVELDNIPDRFRVTDISEYQLKVTLSGKGVSLRKAKRRDGHPFLVKPERFFMSSGHAALSTQFFLDSIKSVVPQSLNIRDIEPDSLKFSYILQKKVKVPIEYEGTLKSENQFILDRLFFNPDSVVVGMPANMKDSDFSMKVDLENIDITHDTVRMNLNLKKVEGVVPDCSEVSMTVISSQFTEKSVAVPIEGLNFPDGKLLKSFPSKVDITFWVKLSDFDKVTAQDFRVVVDYNDIENTTSDRIAVRLYYCPTNVTKVRLMPTSVSYLIEDILPER